RAALFFLSHSLRDEGQRERCARRHSDGVFHRWYWGFFRLVGSPNAEPAGPRPTTPIAIQTPSGNRPICRSISSESGAVNVACRWSDRVCHRDRGQLWLRAEGLG